jgi:hypothetical protein
LIARIQEDLLLLDPRTTLPTLEEEPGGEEQLLQLLLEAWAAESSPERG